MFLHNTNKAVLDLLLLGEIVDYRTNHKMALAARTVR